MSEKYTTSDIREISKGLLRRIATRNGKRSTTGLSEYLEILQSYVLPKDRLKLLTIFGAMYEDTLKPVTETKNEEQTREAIEILEKGAKAEIIDAAEDFLQLHLHTDKYSLRLSLTKELTQEIGKALMAEGLVTAPSLDKAPRSLSGKDEATFKNPGITVDWGKSPLDEAIISRMMNSTYLKEKLEQGLKIPKEYWHDNTAFDTAKVLKNTVAYEIGTNNPVEEILDLEGYEDEEDTDNNPF